MIVYILAIPVFSFLVPIYAFWHFDDFSWGNTRIVLGDKGQKKAVGPEEGAFDPASIPTKRWADHEHDLLFRDDRWEKSTTTGSYYNGSVAGDGLPPPSPMRHNLSSLSTQQYPSSRPMSPATRFSKRPL